MNGNLTDLARMSGMPSEVTLRRLITRHPDFPIVTRGSKGKPYLFDLDAAAAFVRSLSEARKIDPVLRRQAIRELGLGMLEQRDREKEGRDG